MKNLLKNLTNIASGGGVEKSKGKGIPILNRRFVSLNERRRSLLDDGDVQNLLYMAYHMRSDDLLNGISPCNSGMEVSNRLKEFIL